MPILWPVERLLKPDAVMYTIVPKLQFLIDPEFYGGEKATFSV